MNEKAAVKEKGSTTAAKQKASTKAEKQKTHKLTVAEKDAVAQDELAHEKARSDRAEGALEGLKSRAETAEQELVTARNEVKGLKRSEANLRNQTTLAKTRRDELVREAKASAEKLVPLQKEVAALSKRIVEADKETAAQKTAYEDVRRKIGPLRQEIAALKGSFPMAQKARDKAQIARNAAIENVSEERSKRKELERALANLREGFDRLVEAGGNALGKLPDGGDAAALKEALPRSVKTKR